MGVSGCAPVRCALRWEQGRGMATSGGGTAGIFISYRRADASWPARWLADQLTGQFGAGVVFQDMDSIRPGDDFAAEIEAAVGGCSVLLAVIGPHWLTAEDSAGRRLDDRDDWVRLEIEAAIRRGVRVIPVLVDGAGMPTAGKMPVSLQELSRKQAVSLSPASLDTRKLVSVLEAALGHEEAARRPATRPPEPAPLARSRASRLLMSAVHDASALTGEDKAAALAAVVRAAVVATPERVEWLVGEAQTAAFSIENDASRARALARVAGAVAPTDPERANWLTGVAHSTAILFDASSRGLALAGVAQEIAVADPEHAEFLARSIQDASGRGSALAGVAQAVAVADPERAEALARSIDDASSRGSALAGVAQAVAVADPERAEALARSIDDASSRGSALAGVAQAVAVADPERAEALARSIDDASSRSSALANLARLLAQRDLRSSQSADRLLETSRPMPMGNSGRGIAARHMT